MCELRLGAADMATNSCMSSLGSRLFHLHPWLRPDGCSPSVHRLDARCLPWPNREQGPASCQPIGPKDSARGFALRGPALDQQDPAVGEMLGADKPDQVMR